MTTWPSRRGPHVSEGERDAAYRFGRGIAGPRAPFSVGPKGLPRPLFLFSFLFCFLISFVSFAKMLQIDSNQFVKFPRIQHNNLEL
jgi:hypothetical protein